MQILVGQTHVGGRETPGTKPVVQAVAAVVVRIDENAPRTDLPEMIHCDVEELRTVSPTLVVLLDYEQHQFAIEGFTGILLQPDVSRVEDHHIGDQRLDAIHIQHGFITVVAWVRLRIHLEISRTGHDAPHCSSITLQHPDEVALGHAGSQITLRGRHSDLITVGVHLPYPKDHAGELFQIPVC